MARRQRSWPSSSPPYPQRPFAWSTDAAPEPAASTVGSAEGKRASLNELSLTPADCLKSSFPTAHMAV